MILLMKKVEYIQVQQIKAHIKCKSSKRNGSEKLTKEKKCEYLFVLKGVKFPIDED